MLKRWTFIFVSLIVLMMSWETSLEASGIIPDDSIRIRILANSDSVTDQWIKRKVRDAIIEETNQWVGQLNAQEIASARYLIMSHIPELQQVAENTLQQYGFHYGAQVELASVPFPAKQFGNHIYPENQYEALRITLGQGEGANWWCVLFPPLCFIDGTVVAESVAADSYPQENVDKVKNQIDEPAKSKKSAKDSKNTAKESKKTAKESKKSDQSEPKVKPAFFIVELWKSWF